MILGSLDLEMNQPSGKIIQIGYVVGDIHTGEVLDGLSLIVNPEESISPFIQKLTRIDDDRVNKEGKSLDEQYNTLKDFVVKYQPFLNPLVWGSGESNDSSYLRNALGDPRPWVFGRRVLDVKTIFVMHRIRLNEKPQSGLSKSMARCGMQFYGCKHDAYYDAYNTFKFGSLFIRKGFVSLTENEGQRG